MVTDLVTLWASFAIAGALIVVGALRVVRFADRFAEVTGFGRFWVGMLLLATATSVPELVVGVGSIVVADSPDLGAGDAFGSNIANLLILVLLGLVPGWHVLLARRSADATAVGLQGVALIMAAGGLVLLGQWTAGGGPWPVRLLPLALPAAYLVFLTRTFRQERGTGTQSSPAGTGVAAGPRPAPRSRLLTPVAGYLVSAGLVIGAGLWIAATADSLAAEMGWTASYFGSQFLAITTSLPELVVAIAAMRMGAADLAKSNLLGSNVFNMGTVLGADTVAYGPGGLFSALSAVHAFTASIAIVMTLLVVFYPAHRWMLMRRAPSPEPVLAAGRHVVVTAAAATALYVIASSAAFSWG